ncbi:uncharacterized protein LOC135837613 isoform X2 [Planococcus citri]|uniref:uncharacterized protein LOC135837613 isoform X2 n=1 Tax=Planococcus citri TaxID=170843 RepID=UPI0031F9FC9F
MRLFLIFGALLLLYCNECESTQTVVFVYDKVNATEYDVNLFTGKIKQFFATLFQTDGDFDYHLKIVVPDKSYIQEVSKFNSTGAKVTRRNDTTIKGQSTLKTVLTQLQESPSYSVIYVITNVTKPISNDIQLDSILEEIQIKRTQVNFLIETEFCLQTDSLQEYGLISSASDGFAQMGPKLFKYHQFPVSIYMKLNSAPRKVCSLEIKTTDEDRTSCINMDSFFINAVVQKLIFGSLDSDEYEIHAVDHHRIETATGTSKICTDTYKKLNRAELQFVIAAYTGEHEFHYGFSTEDVVESLNETFKRPIKGHKSR